MDKKDLFKKYWFVGVLTILLFVFIGAYIYNDINNREYLVPSKNVNGQDIAYSFNGEDVTADELYDDLFNDSSNGAKAGLIAAYTQYQRAVLEKAYETTQEMKDEASYNAYYVLQNYKEDQISSDLSKYGYKNGSKDLTDYYIASLKYSQLLKDFYKNNYDEYLKPVIEETNPRIIYHILVKTGDIKNPTDEEKAKLDLVLEELKSKPFTTVANEQSDDTGSAAQYGYLGICDTSYDPTSEDQSTSKYVKEFYDAAMALKDDEVSDVIETQYGYHIIWCTSTQVDDLLDVQAFQSKLEEKYPLVSAKALDIKAKECGFVIKNEDLKNYVESALESEAQ